MKTRSIIAAMASLKFESSLDFLKLLSPLRPQGFTMYRTYGHKYKHPSKYKPHQGIQECARRVRQREVNKGHRQ